MKNSKKVRGLILISLGLALFIGAGVWFNSNVQEDKSAGKSSAKILKKVENEQKENKTSDVIYVEDSAFCGTVKIKKLGIKLPVFDKWTDDNLKKAPCRYSGSVQDKNMIVVAHNYKSHFGSLQTLRKGDEIIFTDAYNIKHIYQVSKVTSLEKTDVEQMKSGKWDFTLFTCTISREHRVTVRCFEKTGGK